MKSLIKMEPFRPPMSPEDKAKFGEILKPARAEMRSENRYHYSRLQSHFCAVPWQEVISYWFDEEIKYWWNLANILREECTMEQLKKQLDGRKIPAVLKGEDELKMEGWQKMMQAKIKLFNCKKQPTPKETTELIEHIDTVVTYQFVRAVAYTSVLKPLINDQDLQCPFSKHTFLPIKMMRTLIFHMARGRNPKPLKQ